jgi:hypothetical protein
VLAFGINDCATSPKDQLESIVKRIIAAVRELADDASTGTKSFLVLDVPPVDRSPGGEYRGYSWIRFLYRS